MTVCLLQHTKSTKYPHTRTVLLKHGDFDSIEKHYHYQLDQQELSPNNTQENTTLLLLDLDPLDFSQYEQANIVQHMLFVESSPHTDLLAQTLLAPYDHDNQRSIIVSICLTMLELQEV